MTAVVLFAATLAVSASLSGQGAGPRRDGNWEVTIEMQMAGMPGGMPPMKTTQCITPQDAADPKKAIPQGPQRGRGGAPDNCTISDYKTEGNKVTYAMKCTGDPEMTGNGEFIYGTDSYTGTMNMNMNRGGTPMAMTMKYTGKRLGDCTK
jgi:hypothetical protein